MLHQDNPQQKHTATCWIRNRIQRCWLERIQTIHLWETIGHIGQHMAEMQHSNVSTHAIWTRTEKMYYTTHQENPWWGKESSTEMSRPLQQGSTKLTTKQKNKKSIQQFTRIKHKQDQFWTISWQQHTTNIWFWLFQLITYYFIQCTKAMVGIRKWAKTWENMRKWARSWEIGLKVGKVW